MHVQTLAEIIKQCHSDHKTDNPGLSMSFAHPDLPWGTNSEKKALSKSRHLGGSQVIQQRGNSRAMTTRLRP